MSTFAVTVELIDTVLEHPNAERLELASLKGMSFQFCVPKGEYKGGDPVVYFPVDSLIPENVIELLGLTGKLSGKDKNRVRTIKLRGSISQGIVTRPESLNISTYEIGQDLTEALGVAKYELPEYEAQKHKGVRDGRLVPLPQLVFKYDIEGADRYPEIIAHLLDESVVITEKIEGSHFSASLYADGEYAVCQRNFRIYLQEGENHDWHQAAAEQGVKEALHEMFQSVGGPVQVLTFRGEIIGPGIQGNIYKLEKRKIVFFEIERDGIPVPVLDALGWFAALGLECVPVVALGRLGEILGGQTVQQYSTGYSVLPCANILKDTLLREGIVIRPVKEMRTIDFGRVIIKQRSPEYLDKTGL